VSAPPRWPRTSPNSIEGESITPPPDATSAIDHPVDDLSVVGRAPAATVSPTAESAESDAEDAGSSVLSHLVGLAPLLTAAGLAFGWFVARLPLDNRDWAVVIAGIGGALFALLAATRFATFIVVVLAVRPMLDNFKVGGVGESALDPSTTVGALTLVMSVAWLFVRWRSGELREFSNVSLAALGVATFSLISAIGSTDPVTSAQNGLRVSSWGLMFVVLEQLVGDRPQRARALLFAVFVSFLAPAVIGSYQLLTNSGAVEFGKTILRLTGGFVHPNVFAAYLVILCALCVGMFPHVHGRLRWGVGALMAITGIMLVFTYARAPWLAFVIAVLVIGAMQDKRILLGALIALGLIVVLVPSVTTRLSDLSSEYQYGQGDPNSLAWRFRYWEEVAPLANTNPVTGIGLGMVQESTDQGLQPHNSYLQSYVETGIVGLVSFLTFLGAMVASVRRSARAAPPGLGRGIAVASTGVALGFLPMILTENMFLQTSIWWYLAVLVSVSSVAANPGALARPRLTLAPVA
jgi:putative inorganic carbon (hco3(-)) transporter